MASQAAIVAETIAGMKRALKRKAYDSDSDNEIEHLTNRGNKLKKKARYVHRGQLAPPTGPVVYKRQIEHAGYQRDIISRNPPLIDEDGYEVDSDDDDERAQAVIAAAAELDPYSGVKIEHLLAPLTAASELPDHPTLSKPFLSKNLTELTRDAGEMVQKEKASLWRIKHLLTRLCGDNTWIPCESVETDNDFALFFDERDRSREHLGKAVSRVEGDQASTGTLTSEEVDPPTAILAPEAPSAEAALAAAKQTIETSITNSDPTPKTGLGIDAGGLNATGNDTDAQPSGSVMGLPANQLVGPGQNTTAPSSTEMELDAVAKPPTPPEEGGGETVETPTESIGEIAAPRRMRTRAQAAASDNSAPSRTRSISPESGHEFFVHPYFLAPQSSLPDRNLGLPQNEADEIRRLLQLYIQKQEEICRGSQKVYDGLLKADRLRKTVMKWAKAEAHVGVNRDMSDGEDWYDKEEWGLDEDLKKGQDEEEEDAATTAKKTRTRRQ